MIRLLLHPDKLLRIFGSIAAVGLVIFSLVFSYAMLGPVDVLKNWTLTGTEKEYHVGDTVTITSTANKVMNVAGDSHRSLVCRTGGNSEQQYDLPDANANRTQGVAVKTISIIIPTNTLTNLPAQCQVQVLITYYVYGFRRFPEVQRTPIFTVQPRETTSTTTVINTATAGTVENSPTATATQTTQTTETPTQATVEPTQVAQPVTTPDMPAKVTLLNIPVCIPFTGVCLYE